MNIFLRLQNFVSRFTESVNNPIQFFTFPVQDIFDVLHQCFVFNYLPLFGPEKDTSVPFVYVMLLLFLSPLYRCP